MEVTNLLYPQAQNDLQIQNPFIQKWVILLLEKRQDVRDSPT